jgi:hypothetical protein
LPTCLRHVFRLSDAVDPDAAAGETSVPSSGPTSEAPPDSPTSLCRASRPATRQDSTCLPGGKRGRIAGKTSSTTEYAAEPRRQRGLTGVERDTAIEMDQCFSWPRALLRRDGGDDRLFLRGWRSASPRLHPYVGGLLHAVFLDPAAQAGFVIVAQKQLKGNAGSLETSSRDSVSTGAGHQQPVLAHHPLVMLSPYFVGIRMLIFEGHRAPPAKQLETALPILIGVQVSRSCSSAVFPLPHVLLQLVTHHRPGVQR